MSTACEADLKRWQRVYEAFLLLLPLLLPVLGPSLRQDVDLFSRTLPLISLLWVFNIFCMASATDGTVSAQIYTLKPNSNVIVFGDGAFLEVIKVRQCYRVGFLSGRTDVLVRRRRDTRVLSLRACTEERPCEDTERRQLSSSQEEFSPET